MLTTVGRTFRRCRCCRQTAVWRFPAVWRRCGYERETAVVLAAILGVLAKNASRLLARQPYNSYTIGVPVPISIIGYGFFRASSGNSIRIGGCSWTFPARRVNTAYNSAPARWRNTPDGEFAARIVENPFRFPCNCSRVQLRIILQRSCPTQQHRRPPTHRPTIHHQPNPLCRLRRKTASQPCQSRLTRTRVARSPLDDAAGPGALQRAA